MDILQRYVVGQVPAIPGPDFICPYAISESDKASDRLPIHLPSASSGQAALLSESAWGRRGERAGSISVRDIWQPHIPRLEAWAAAHTRGATDPFALPARALRPCVYPVAVLHVIPVFAFIPPPVGKRIHACRGGTLLLVHARAGNPPASMRTIKATERAPKQQRGRPNTKPQRPRVFGNLALGNETYRNHASCLRGRCPHTGCHWRRS